MKILPYIKERTYDDGLKFICDMIRKSTISKDDDYLMLCVGEPGSGKSNLALHAMNEYMGDKEDIKFIGLNRSSFASAIKAATDAEKPRMVLNDEANINKRDSLSEYNKSVMDLYYSIRGLNIFHIWANPSLEMIDRVFIRERVKGIIYVHSKGKFGRFYYFFKQNAILNILDKYQTLDLRILSRVKGKYALYRGWFKEYNGKLKIPYLAMKNERMNEKVDDFFKKFCKDEYISLKEFVSIQGISLPTAKKYIPSLDPLTDYITSDVGKLFLTNVGKEKMIELFKKGIELRNKNLK